MSRLALVLFTTLLFAFTGEAQPPDVSRAGRLARSASMIDVNLIAAPLSITPPKSVPDRSPFGQASKLVTKLVDVETHATGSPQKDTSFLVKPWFGGRNAVGVKVELTW